MRLFKGKFHHWVLFLVIQPYSFATPGNRYRLLTVDDNGEMLMDAEGRQKLFPPVLTGIRPVTQPDRHAGEETFDLSGRKIHQPQPPLLEAGKEMRVKYL